MRCRGRNHSVCDEPTVCRCLCHKPRSPANKQHAAGNVGQPRFGPFHVGQTVVVKETSGTVGVVSGVRFALLRVTLAVPEVALGRGVVRSLGDGRVAYLRTRNAEVNLLGEIVVSCEALR